jgi:hypothetical protein
LPVEINDWLQRLDGSAAEEPAKAYGVLPGRIRHCEERRDEAIQGPKGALHALDCFASLAMTNDRAKRSLV